MRNIQEAEKMRRQLSIEIGKAVLRYTDMGIPGWAIIAALEEHLAQERRLAEQQAKLERTY